MQSAQLATAQANFRDAQQKAKPSSPQIAQLELQIQQASTQVELDRKNYNRYKELIKTNAVAQVEYDKAKLQFEASQNNLKILEKSLDDLRLSLKLNLDNAYNQLKIQQQNTDDYFINSAIKGKVLNVLKNQGELVRRGETLAKIGGGKTVIRL